MTSPSSPTLTWRDLPSDVKRRIWSHIRLDEMLSTVQHGMPSPLLHATLSHRIAALYPLHAAWVSCPRDAVRNLPRYRTPSARAEVLPAEFVTLERLVVGHTSLGGVFPSAVAELAWTLKVLHCDNIGLSSFGPGIARCQRLVNLDASGNDFRSMPEVVCQISSLKLVSFSQNPRLGPRLPGDIPERLPGLNRIGFYECALEELPESFIRMVAEREDAVFANVYYNAFPSGYLEGLFRERPILRSRITIV